MGYEDQIAPQEAKVKKLSDEYAAKPTDDLKAKLVSETDLLHYLKNAAKGGPHERARKAAFRARKSILGKVVP